MGSTSPDALEMAWGGAENIYRRAGLAFKHLDREHWRIHCVCHLSFVNFSPEERATRLRDAWKRLAIEYPRLVVTPNGTESKIYQVFADASDVETWAQATFAVEAGKTADDIIQSTGLRDLPSLHFLPETSEVVLLTSHWRMDAVGCMMLLDRLFTLTTHRLVTSRLSTRHEQIARLSPSLEDAADCPPMDDTSPSPQASKSYAESWVENLHRKAINASSSGPPYQGDNTTPPRNTTSQEITLSSTSTNALVAACKSKDISVTAAIHTALAHTVFSFSAPPDTSSEYTAVMAVNLRPYLPAPYNGPEHAVQTYVASITPTVRREGGFLASARGLTREYGTWYSEEFVRALRWIYVIHAQRLFNPPPHTPPRTPAPVRGPPSGITLSSLGVVERYLRGDYSCINGDSGGEDGVKVESFRFGVTMMTRQMLLYPWTFRGKLTLSLCYNEGYYAVDEVRGILEKLREILGKELDVDIY